MLDRIVKFLIKFFISATVIFVIWIYVGVYYQYFVLELSKPILLLMGYNMYQISALRLLNAYMTNFNLVPFLALILSIEVDIRSRIKITILGLIVMIAIHLTDLIAHFPAYFQQSELAIMIVYSLPILNVGFPFLLWIIWFFSLHKRSS